MMSLPLLLVSTVIVVTMVIILVQCVCGKRKQNSEAEVKQTTSNHCSTFLDADTLHQMQTDGDVESCEHVDIENGITPLNVSVTSHNGGMHSRGNSVDLNKADRYSGTSTGSSPRPATLSRELPDIPGTKPHNIDRGHHSTLPELPSTSDSHNKSTHSVLPDIPTDSQVLTNSVEIHRKGGYSHSKLPEIPSNSDLSESVDTPGGSTAVSVSRVKSLHSSTADDYDHIEEKSKKKLRPRSDYDHVVIEGGEKRIVLAKSKINENDYAEVKNNDLYEPVAQDVTVIPISKPPSTSNTKHTQKSLKNHVHKTDSFDDPYNRIKDDTPYNKIKDKSPYNKIKDATAPYKQTKDNPYNKIRVDDTYNTVRDDGDDLDPYNTVNDESNCAMSSGRKKTVKHSFKGPVYDPYALVVDEERNVSNQTDPYSRVGDTDCETDDPYNKVGEENDSSSNTLPVYGEDDYATVNKAGEFEYAKVNKVGGERRNEETDNAPPSPREEIVQDEYATVVKVRKLNNGAGCNTNTSRTSPGRNDLMDETANVIPGPVTLRKGNNPATPGETTVTVRASIAAAPTEPPRDYDDDVDHYNTVAVVHHTDNSKQGLKKEPPYNKLSVRESLASMNARAASNTYEYVSEVDNLYATVEGSSGDGVVRPQPQPDNGAVRQRSQVTEGAVMQRSQPDISEPHTSDYYTELDVPDPPSLDSLHETAKQHQDEIRRKIDKKPDYYNLDGASQSQEPEHQMSQSGQGHAMQGHSRTPSGQGHFTTASNDRMTSSFEGRVPIAMEESVDLEFEQNYQSVAEDKIPDSVSEFDPNYETVEEAHAKLRYEEINGARAKHKVIRPHIYEDPDAKRKYEVVKGETRTENGKIRAHVYEEVKVSSEARRVRQRVLNQHMYEELPEVKGKEISQNMEQTNAECSNDNRKKKEKGHERNSSGDWLFGKRKSGDSKDKTKESKRKSEGYIRSSKM